MKLRPLHAVTLRLLPGIILLLIAASSHAASITWGLPTNITGDSDVSATGSIVGAFNVGGSGVASTTINGVNFQSFAVPSTGFGATVGNFAISSGSAFNSTNTQTGSTNPPFNTLSAQYQTLLAAATANFTTFTLTISGLTSGAQYAFQWWANNSNGNSDNLHTATAGNTVSLQHNTLGATDGGVGQFVIGTFTADAATQSIIFGGPSYALLNGFQLRQQSVGAVPESGTTFLLLALGSCVCLVTGWRLRSAVAG